jgi:head-tail adaptor
MHRPQKAAQMTTPCKLQLPIEDSSIDVPVTGFVDYGKTFFANFSTYGSSEQERNGIDIVEENTILTTWYNPRIEAGCRIVRLTDGKIFDVVGEPENVEMRDMFSVVKVRRVRGTRTWVRY